VKKLLFYCTILISFCLVFIGANLEPIINSLLNRYHNQIERELGKTLAGTIRIGKLHLDGLINAKLQAHPVVFIPQAAAPIVTSWTI
jgi:hypothetical protein